MYPVVTFSVCDDYTRPVDLNLEDTIRTIRAVYGRDLSHYDSSFLAKTVKSRLESLRLGDEASYPEYLVSNGDEALGLIASLNITYSEFFRESLSFSILENIVLPDIVESKDERSEIRVWSAGCAGGQEAYSLAILLSEITAASPKKLRYRIFATDISEKNLATAREGAYDTAALKNVAFGRVEKYFTRHGDTYSIIPELREQLDFSRHDLLDEFATVPAESIFGEFDLVLCRNLLIYYTRKVRNEILDRLHKSLSASGYLALGEAERGEAERRGNFKSVAAQAPIFRKILAGRTT